MRREELRIEGMSCGHCVMSVKKELAKITGLQVEDVQIGKATVQYDESRISPQDLMRAVEAAGYRLIAP
ncbi:MAG: heavy-metal-associated domain-containing protein [Bacteroidota bacterium]